MSRRFVYQQAHKAVAALDDAFLSATPGHEVLFEVAVTKAWLRQVIVGLTLVCHSSYRGVVEFLRDLLGLPVSIGTVHQVLQSATRQAGIINRQQDLSGIRVGLHAPCRPSLPRPIQVSARGPSADRQPRSRPRRREFLKPTDCVEKVHDC